MKRLVAGLVACGFLGAFIGAVHAAPRLELAVPADAIGDGVTSIAVTALVTPASAVKRVTSLTLIGTAGVVGSSTAAGENGVTFRFIPPRVAVETTVILTATAMLGGRRLRARKSIRVGVPASSRERRRSTGAFQIETPKWFVLGRDKSATVSIAATMAEAPVLYVSAGSLSDLRDAGNGRLEATYSPPDESYPQVAIIAAQSKGGEKLDWTVMPLSGLGSVALRSEPRASVLVRVGDDEFGPVRTNAQGRATLRIAAPPGARVAKTTATDHLGNIKTGILQLGAPPFNRMLAICPHASSRVVFLVVGEGGVPAEGASIAGSASVGRLSDVRTVAKGQYDASYSAPSGAVIGDEVTIEATLSGDSTSKAQCRAPIPGEVPASAEVWFEPAEYVAGNGAPVTVWVKPSYEGRLPPLAVPISVNADAGKVSALERQPDGSFSASFQPPDRLDGRAKVLVTVSSPKVKGALATLELPLRAGPVASLQASSSRTKVRANGRDTAIITVKAADAFGNPVSKLSLKAIGKGTVSVFEQAGAGVYTMRFTPAASYRHRTEQIRIYAVDTDVSALVPLGLQPLRRRHSVAVKLGYLTNTAKVSSPVIGIEAAMQLPVGVDNLWVAVDVSFYRSEQTEMSAGDGEPVTTTVIAMPLLARVAYFIPFDRYAVYASGGIGVLIGSAGIESVSAGKVVDRQLRFAVSARAGTDLELGPGRGFFEAGYLYAGVDTGSVKGNVGGVQATAGYRYEF